MSTRPWAFRARISRLKDSLEADEDEAAEAGAVVLSRPTPGSRAPWKPTFPLLGRVHAAQRGGRVEVEARRCRQSPPRLKQHRALQAELDAELLGVVQLHVGDHHLDHHLRRLGVDPLDDPLDLG